MLRFGIMWRNGNGARSSFNRWAISPACRNSSNYDRLRPADERSFTDRHHLCFRHRRQSLPEPDFVHFSFARPSSPLRLCRLGGVLLLANMICSACPVISVGSVTLMAGEVAVSLNDGRRFIAEVDDRTDDARLWLRFGNGPTTIRRAFAWSDVRSASENGAAVDNARLRELGRAAIEQRGSNDDHLTFGNVAEPRGGLRTWKLPNDAARGANAFTGTVRSLDVDGYLANWDADVDADGVLLTVAALDEFGAAAPVEGTLEVELIGERLPPYSRGNAFPVLARWQQAITSADIAASGGVHRVRLEFQAQHPDYQLSLPNYALLHVRFTVPGQGTFDASRDGLSLRGFTPVRDRLEAASGTRLFTSEQTGRGHRESSLSRP